MISIITTVKDGEAFLADAFDAILAQTCRDFEICVHNDGSSDKTSEIIYKYSQIFTQASIPFLHSFESVSKGVGYGKNAAIRLSSGRFLCFNDADDISLPKRLACQLEAALNAPDPDNCFIGCNFDRIPQGSTERYRNWACSLTDNQLHNQIFTSFGPTLLSPCWFIPKALYDKVGEFFQDMSSSYPEDLDFFYKALKFQPSLIKVNECLVLYRYHSNCATFSVSEEIMWKLRVAHLEYSFLNTIEQFSIWDIGRRGRKLYKDLTAKSRAKVVQYCDSNSRHVSKKFCEIQDDKTGKVIAKIPAVKPCDVKTPVVICEKMKFISSEFYDLVVAKKWIEGKDFVLLNEMAGPLFSSPFL